MLTTLRIKNLALVSDLTVELQPGFIAITGETGAGKSIIIGALNLLLGERADRTLIRSGCDSCSVEAVFDVSALGTAIDSVLAENGLEPCEDNQLVIKRVFAAAGSNRQFINGSPTTLTVLGLLGDALVDIHGPHDHQSLLHPSAQLLILDAYGKLDKLRASFATLTRRLEELESEKAALVVDDRTYAQQLDMLRFQVNEISDAKLQPGEATDLEQAYQRAHNAARLIQLSQAALSLLSQQEGSVFEQMGILGRTLHELERLDPGTSALIACHEQAVGCLQELQHQLSRYADRIDVDPARLQQLEERLNLINALKRKYGATMADVIGFGESARQKLEQLEQREVELERIHAEMRKVEADLWRVGRELSAKRRKVIPELSKAAMKQLADLGFKQCKFQVEISTLEQQAGSVSRARLSQAGLDTIEFQFAPNVGEPARPLRAIASSGEMARVMLALKTVLAVEDRIPVLVFDEVDANIGGQTAQAVGDKMRQIGRQHQVLCITHLAPVAVGAAAHYMVTKQVKAGRTISAISLLDKPERINELARMLGGQSTAARRHAEALLKDSSG